MQRMSEVFKVKPLRSRYLHFIRVELRLNVYILLQAEEGWLFTQLTVCCSFMYFRKMQLVHKLHNLAIGTTTSKNDRMLPLLSVNEAICHPGISGYHYLQIHRKRKTLSRTLVLTGRQTGGDDDTSQYFAQICQSGSGVPGLHITGKNVIAHGLRYTHTHTDAHHPQQQDDQ